MNITKQDIFALLVYFGLLALIAPPIGVAPLNFSTFSLYVLASWGAADIADFFFPAKIYKDEEL